MWLRQATQLRHSLEFQDQSLWMSEISYLRYLEETQWLKPMMRLIHNFDLNLKLLTQEID